MASTTPHGSTPHGEAALLARMLPHLRTGSEVEVGPGDDAAVVRLPSPRLVVTTDMLVEGHDFMMHATTPRWIGRKAAVQNLADVAAMGAAPLALVVAISAPASTPATVFEELTIGLTARAEADGASIVGGDLGRAEDLTVTVTAMGSLPADQEPVRRSGALPGDVLAIGAPAWAAPPPVSPWCWGSAPWSGPEPTASRPSCSAASRTPLPHIFCNGMMPPTPISRSAGPSAAARAP